MTDPTPNSMIDDLRAEDVQLSTWEIDFIAAAEHRLESGGTLRATELHRLTEIHNQRVIESDRAEREETDDDTEPPTQATPDDQHRSQTSVASPVPPSRVPGVPQARGRG